MKDLIDLLFRDRAYYASVQDGVFILASMSDVLIPHGQIIPQDFFEFVRKVSEEGTTGRAVNGKAIFAEEINVENNNFKDKFGKWHNLVGFEPDRHYRTYLNRPTVMIYEKDKVDLLSSNSEPIYEKGQINRKVESIDGTFPKAHSVVIPKENGGFYTAMVPGYSVKIAIETDSNILIGKGITMIANRDFTIISGNLSNMKDRPKLQYSCGKSTTLSPDAVSWFTEEECFEKLFTCESAFNILKQPQPGSSLFQMTRYWSGKMSHYGIEGLMWNGWDEEKIIELIQTHVDSKQNEFAYYKLGKLVENIEEDLTGYDRRKFIEGCKEIEQIFIALNHRGHPINQQVEQALSALANRKQQLVRGNNGFY